MKNKIKDIFKKLGVVICIAILALWLSPIFVLYSCLKWTNFIWNWFISFVKEVWASTDYIDIDVSEE